MKRASGKVVVITGGNSGIGKGIAKKFIDAGAKVVIFGRNQETLQKTKQEFSGELLAIQGDVSKTEDLKRLFSETTAHFGKIDVLVPNAGVGRRIPLAEASEETFDRVVDTNYRGLYFTVKYALDHLNNGASIILIASVAAHCTAKNHTIYASTKAAIVKLTQNLAFDLADRGIRVNSVSPGFIETPIFDEQIKKEPDFYESRAKKIPLKRIGMPEDIAHAIFFLSSDEASYITGADLIIDGGLVASSSW